MMVMIVMHVHEMSRWYDDMVVCVNAISIYVSYENNVVQTNRTWKNPGKSWKFQKGNGNIMEMSWKFPWNLWKFYGKFKKIQLKSMEILWKIMDISMDSYGNSMEISGNFHGNL